MTPKQIEEFLGRLWDVALLEESALADMDAEEQLAEFQRRLEACDWLSSKLAALEQHVVGIKARAIRAKSNLSMLQQEIDRAVEDILINSWRPSDAEASPFRQ